MLASTVRNARPLLSSRIAPRFAAGRRSLSVMAGKQIKVGDKLPTDIKFQTMGKDDKAPQDVDITTLLKGKKAVIFGLPGAFTTICSSKHLPEYNKKAEELAGAGVQVIGCVSVNDAFVMRAWAESLGVDPNKVKLLADGEAKFVRAVGLEQAMPGMGDRSLRFSAFVDDMVVKVLNVEEPGGGSYKVSGPDHMLGDLKGI